MRHFHIFRFVETYKFLTYTTETNFLLLLVLSTIIIYRLFVNTFFSCFATWKYAWNFDARNNIGKMSFHVANANRINFPWMFWLKIEAFYTAAVLYLRNEKIKQHSFFNDVQDGNVSVLIFCLKYFDVTKFYKQDSLRIRTFHVAAIVKQRMEIMWRLCLLFRYTVDLFYTKMNITLLVYCMRVIHIVYITNFISELWKNLLSDFLD